MSIAAEIIARTAGTENPDSKLHEHSELRSMPGSAELDVYLLGLQSWYRVYGEQTDVGNLFIALLGEGAMVDRVREYTVVEADERTTQLRTVDGGLLTVFRLARGEQIEAC